MSSNPLPANWPAADKVRTRRPAAIVDFTPSRKYFPFDSKWFASSVGPVHYIDEGTGRPLLLLHGNPDWSFLYRKVVTGLARSFRCIAIDYPGFGLSVHPVTYNYTPGEHAVVVRELVEYLDLEDMVVMGQDWGGPIGMEVASRMPDRVTGLVMGNTWFWPTESLTMKSFSLVMGSPPMQTLIKKRNFFVSPLMKRMLKAELSREEFNHYRAVVPTPRSRTGIAVFPKQIRGAKAWLGQLEWRVDAHLWDRPMVLIWGMKDPAFGKEGIIQRWVRTFPRAKVVRLDDAGHYIQEDAPNQIVDAIREAYAGQS